MKKLCFVVCLIMLLALFAVKPQGVAQADSESFEVYDFLLDFLKNCPNRVTKTAGEAKAAEYLRKVFLDFGYSADILYSEPNENGDRFCNVAAYNKGSIGKTVVLSAHLDNVQVGEGAFDNGTGIATLAAVAFELRDKELPFDLIFLATGGEEVGFLGASEFLNKYNDISEILLNVNFDSCAGGDNIYMYCEDIPTPQLDYFTIASYGTEIEITPVTNLPSIIIGERYYHVGFQNDAYIFKLQEIPTLFFFSGNLNNSYGIYMERNSSVQGIMHTPNDNLQVLTELNPQTEKQIKSIVKTVVNGLTNSEFTTKIEGAVVVKAIVFQLPRYISIGLFVAVVISAFVIYARPNNSSLKKKKSESVEDIFEFR